MLSHQCSPYHSQSAFFPIIEQIKIATKITTRDSNSDKLTKLKTYFAGSIGDSINSASLIANLLSITPERDHELLELTPQQIKNRTITKLVDMLLALSTRRPTLCIFEDVHWIDPSTLELLELVISRIDRASILLVVSCRPEFRSAWFTRANVTMHSLTRLSRSEVTAMIRDLLRGGTLPQKTLDEIIDKADGVPLFIEELTSSTQRAPIRARLEEGSAVHKVPETLHDALMERLDRVAPGHRIAQTAAVIGREFSYDLLSFATGIGGSDLSSALSILEEADIIYRVDISPFVRFAFKHVLLRDAIYNSLLRAKRQEIHADIAAILETHFHELVESQPEILAYHYGEAGDYQSAVNYWRMSGRRAFANSANVEAIAHFRKALEVLAALPETPKRNEQESEIQLALGIPLIAVRGYAATETRDAFARARALCLSLDNAPKYFQAMFGLWGHSWMGGKHDEALNMANEFLARSLASAEPVLSMVAHRVMGSTLLTGGEFQSAKKHFEQSIALSVTDKQPLHNLYMVEPHVASLLLLSWDLWFLGYPDQSLSRVSEALSLAKALSHPYTIAFAHYMTSVVHLLRGNPDGALASAEESLEMSQEQRFSLYIVLSTISRGRAFGELGRLREAKTEIRQGIDEARGSGVGFMLPMMESWLADIYAQSGDNEAALSIVEKTLSDLSDVTGRSWEAELYRQRGQLLLALNRMGIGEAETSLKEAIIIARRQSAKSLELRAASALATLWRTQERLDEARDLIEPIYSWFNEGADTADLRRARDVRVALN